MINDNLLGIRFEAEIAIYIRVYSSYENKIKPSHPTCLVFLHSRFGQAKEESFQAFSVGSIRICKLQKG